MRNYNPEGGPSNPQRIMNIKAMKAAGLIVYDSPASEMSEAHNEGCKDALSFILDLYEKQPELGREDFFNAIEEYSSGEDLGYT